MLLALIQTPEWWERVPWGAITSLFLLACAVAVVLLKDRLRSPTTFVTSDQAKASSELMMQELKHLSEKFEELSRKVEKWETEFRNSCASATDVTKMGEKLDRLEKAQIGLYEQAANAQTASARALSEVAGVKGSLEGLERRVADLGGIPKAIGRLEGKMSLVASKILGRNVDDEEAL